jgi:hypothetical protein
MDLLSDVITYVRRIIKTPSNAVITDNLIIDYINRFWIMDVDARIQLFDLKSKYQFQTQPGVDQYNMPLYSVQTEQGGQNISFYPVYQGFLDPVYVNGIQVPFQTDKTTFFNIWPNIVQQMYTVGTGTGSQTNFTFQFPVTPNNTTPVGPPFQYFLRGHTDITGIVAAANNTGNLMDPIYGTTLSVNGSGTMNVPSTSIFPAVYITAIDANFNSMVVQDSGQFLQVGGFNMPNYGLLMNPGNAPFGYTASGAYSTTLNTFNYLTGQCNVTFPVAPAAGTPISAQAFLFQCGLPRGCLFWNNTLVFRSPPDQQYLIELDGYLSPAAFLSSSAAVQFGYMSEYIARGAARKILADTGDLEQFQFYEPLFKEQETLVWKRSQRQFTSTRTPTIYSGGGGANGGNNGWYGS